MHAVTCQIWAKWLLRLTGILVCNSAIAIFLPNSWMDAIHRELGLGELPTAPIVEYLARSLSAMYFAHGLILLAISANAVRFWPLVGVVGGMNVFLGSVFLWVDLFAPMPWFWTAFEGPPVVGLGVVLVILWRYGQPHKQST